MCGLVGVAGKLQLKDEEIIKRLLCHDYWRGKDSTGLGAVRESGEFHVAKLKSHPFDLFDMQKFKTACSWYQSVAFLGHNRAATKGVVTTYNAHPFEFGDIIGAHNGTLTAASHTALEEVIGEKFEVDSQALICAIDRIGIEATIALCEESENPTAGAWALTWFDRSDMTLNFLRNKHRPLWYAYSKEFDRVFWASEYWMLDAATGAAGTELATFTHEKGSYRFLGVEENWHYRFDINALKAGGTERPKPKVKVIKGKELAKPAAPDPFGRGATPGSLTQPRGTTTSAGTGKTNTNANGGGTSGRSTRKAEPFVDPRSVRFIGSKDKPYAGYMSESDFSYLAKGGCSYCEAPLSFGECGVTIFEREETILCPSCNTGKGETRIYVKNIKPFL